MLVITDPRADRMRAMVPIRAAEGLEPEELLRLMQANFDSALDDATRAAQGRLGGLRPPAFAAAARPVHLGIAQTVNVARTYGET